jgi:hypothetical protein
MTAEIERALEKLIEQHGVEKVRAALDPLLGQFKWTEWQRIKNLVNRLQQRKKPVNPPKQAKLGERRKSDALK